MCRATIAQHLWECFLLLSQFSNKVCTLFAIYSQIIHNFVALPRVPGQLAPASSLERTSDSYFCLQTGTV